MGYLAYKIDQKPNVKLICILSKKLINKVDEICSDLKSVNINALGKYLYKSNSEDEILYYNSELDWIFYVNHTKEYLWCNAEKIWLVIVNAFGIFSDSDGFVR